MTTQTKGKPTSKEMLDWQYRVVLQQLDQVQLHSSDSTCPCRLKDMGEYCIPKHLNLVASLANETGAMDSVNDELFFDLGEEATELHLKTREHVCGKGESEDIVTWARGWRKKIEPLYYACPVKGKVKLKEDFRFAELFEPPLIRVSGKCENEGACVLSVSHTDKIQAKAHAIKSLPDTIEGVIKALDRKEITASDTTFAYGTTGLVKYELRHRIMDGEKLIASHNPHTFEENPNFPMEMQPRDRTRAATQLQVRNIAKNLNPDLLLVDFRSTDKGAPIIYKDMVVESGNGRMMAILLAADEVPDKLEEYRLKLRSIAPAYNLNPADADRYKIPVLVRERLTPVNNRKSFVDDCNARSTLAMSAIEQAKRDAALITFTMLSSLELLEGESIDQALRATRNLPFVNAFINALPANERASSIDAKGLINTEGVRRAILATFVATFQGDVGIRLAQVAFEELDNDVKTCINGVAASLGFIAQAEKLTLSGQREPGYAIGEDLAIAIRKYGEIKRITDYTVEKYLAQMQLETRELTPFQERVLAVLGQFSRSSKRIAAIITAYAMAVINGPPPQQASFMGGDRQTKEELFEYAVKSVKSQMEAERVERETRARERAAVMADVRVDGERVLNKTYRFMNKKHEWADITADTPDAALNYLGWTRDNVDIAKIWKSSGKIGTAGSISMGWSKLDWKNYPESTPVDRINPRWKIYVAQTSRRPITGPPSNHEYMAFISRMANKYREKKGMFPTQTIVDQDEFTEFIRKEVQGDQVVIEKQGRLLDVATLFATRMIPKEQIPFDFSQLLPVITTVRPMTGPVMIPQKQPTCPPACPTVSLGPTKYALFPFQEEGVAWLKGRSYALLADEMGLGKTPQAIHWGADVRPVLVVVPASLTLNWHREITQMWRPQDGAIILDGKAELPRKLPDWTIMSYGMLNHYSGQIRRAGFNAIIIDEAHLVKNLDTQRTNNILNLVSPAATAEELQERLNRLQLLSASAVKRGATGEAIANYEQEIIEISRELRAMPTYKFIPNRLAVTGTPILNRPIELFPLLVFMGVKKRADFKEFLNTYTEHRTVRGRLVFGNAKNLYGLHQSLKPFMLRRLKKDVLKQLPPKVNTPLFVAITNAEEYRRAERNFLKWLADKKGNEAAFRAANAEIIVKMNSLRQLAAMGKVAPVADWLKPCQEGHGKVIVFSSFKEPLESLAALKNTKVIYTGDLPPPERQQMVDKFQKDPGECYFMGTVGAAGVGITLTASNRVAFMDLPWTPGGKIQAEDRAHRIGQNKPVEIVNVLARGTIDERMLEILQKKEIIISQAIDGKRVEEATSTSIASDLLMHFIRNPGLSEHVMNYESDSVDAKLSDAPLLDYRWLGKKFDKCNLSEEELNKALAWRPLRDLVTTGIGAKAKVQVCSIGLVPGNYQVTFDKLSIAAFDAATDISAKNPLIRRVYTTVPGQRVYEVSLPPPPGEELIWQPQVVMPRPQIEKGEQVAMFDCASLFEKATVKVAGKCQTGADDCTFKVTRTGDEALANGVRELAKAVNQVSTGQVKPANIPESLGKCQTLKVHDDGDLTVRCGGQEYVVTKEGKAFRKISLNEDNGDNAALEAPVKLLTKEVLERLPPLYSQENVKDPVVQVKFFTPDSNWTWYGIEFDGQDTFFGYVIGQDKELGYFSLRELSSYRGRFGLPIERDMYFKPTPLSEVRKLEHDEQLDDSGTSRIPMAEFCVREMGGEDNKSKTQLIIDGKRVVAETDWHRKASGAHLYTALFNNVRDAIQHNAHLREDTELSEHAPKDIIVFPDAIEKHYLSISMINKDSIRAINPAPGILTYLGCPKDEKWGKNLCSKQALIKTIVRITPDNRKKYLNEVEHWRSKGVPVKQGTKGTQTAPKMEEVAPDIKVAIENAVEVKE